MMAVARQGREDGDCKNRIYLLSDRYRAVFYRCPVKAHPEEVWHRKEVLHPECVNDAE